MSVIPTSGTLSLSTIRNVFINTAGSISMSQMYSNGAYAMGVNGIPPSLYYDTATVSISTANALSVSQFYGTYKHRQFWIAVGKNTSLGGNTIMYSTDGNSWSAVNNSSNVFNNYGSSIFWNGNYWLAGGNNTTPSTWGTSVGVSSNGVDWTNLDVGLSICNGVAYTGGNTSGFWVAVGNGGNTISYRPQQYPNGGWGGATGNLIFTTIGHGVVAGGDKFVAVGQSNDSPVTSGSTVGGNYLATGITTGSTIAYSLYSSGNTKGALWVGLGKIFTDRGRGIAYGNNRYVAVGRNMNVADGSTIKCSTNGIQWSNGSNVFTTGGGYAVRWNGSYFVAVGEGTIGTKNVGASTDGLTWSTGNLGLTIGYGVAWSSGGNKWVATGASPTSGGLSSSTNGLQWSTGTTLFTTSANAVYWG